MPVGAKKVNIDTLKFFPDVAECRYTVHYRPDHKIGKPDALTRRSDEENAGLEHRLFDTGQLTCIRKINLARDANEHINSEPIVVAHSGKTMDIPMVPNLVNKSYLPKASIDKTSISLALNMALEPDMSSGPLKIDVSSWLKNSDGLWIVPEEHRLAIVHQNYDSVVAGH